MTTATHRGSVFLSCLNARQKQVLVLVVSTTHNYKEIAQLCGTSEQYVKNMLKYVFTKAGCKSSRQALTLYCFLNGVVECPCGQRDPES